MSTNKLELIKGQLYNIRLTDGHWTKGEFQGIRETNWLRSRKVKRYMFKNILTGRDVELKSMARIKPYTQPVTMYPTNR